MSTSKIEDNIGYGITKYIGNILEPHNSCFTSNRMFSKTSSLLIVSFFTLCSFCVSVAAFASSPVAVLRSAHNQRQYQEQSVGNFDEDWANLIHTLGASNVSYEEISDGEVTLGQSRIGGYKVIVIPMLIDLPEQVVKALDEYQSSGGRLLILDAGGTPESGAKRLEQIAGVTGVKQSTITEKRKIYWDNNQTVNTDEFPIGAALADFNLTSSAYVVGHWQDLAGRNLGPAASRCGNCLFLGWSPAQQGSVSTNASLIGASLESLAPGISQQAAVQISFAEYEGFRNELDLFTEAHR